MNIHTPQRLRDETFEEYKKRRLASKKLLEEVVVRHHSIEITSAPFSKEVSCVGRTLRYEGGRKQHQEDELHQRRWERRERMQ